MLRDVSMLMLRAVLPCLALACFGAHAQPADNPFGRPLRVASASSGSSHQGEIRAVIDLPHSVVAPALASPARWCEILTLQVNVKGCSSSPDTVTAFITRKARDPVEDAHRMDFRFHAAAGADALEVALNAQSGPLGTRDYEIRLRAAPLDAKRTALHLSYAYSLGWMARLAMDAYLGGAGRDKVGFSVAERLPDGRPVYVDGMRGVVERSAMRYYLAVEAVLQSLALPSGQRLEARLRRWYTEIARYPQLREEVGLDEYVEMKRREASAALVG